MTARYFFKSLRYFSSTVEPSKPLISQHALITGGSQGLGLAISKNLASKGCRVTLLARNESKLQANVELLNQQHPISLQHDYLVYDLKNPYEIEQFIKTQYPDYKKINILINCAGMSQHSLLINTNPEDIQSILNVNLVSPIILSKLFARSMMRLYNPNIVNISSILAEKATRGTSVYSIAKVGLNKLTENLALETERKMIKVNSVLPGLIEDTEIGQGVNKKVILGSASSSLDESLVTNTVKVAELVGRLVCSTDSTGRLVHVAG